MNQFRWMATRFKYLALAFLVAGTVAPSQADEAQTETVTAEGVGKTEASAKKAAFKDAIQKVVGVLVDSSTQVKNEEIIKDELLEYSGGFISKSEVLSSKKDDEGLVRVKVKCVVEKTQVKKKLENLSVISVKVDGANLALKELSQEELRKNAAQFISKAIEERKKCFKVDFPKSLSSLKKNEQGELFVPVNVYLDSTENKKWLETWLPVFQKLSDAKITGVSKYMETSFTIPWTATSVLVMDDRKTNSIRSKAQLQIPNRKETIFLLVAEGISNDLKVKWNGFRINCDLTKISALDCGGVASGSQGISIKDWPKLKLDLELLDKSGNLISADEAKPKGEYEGITLFSIANDCQALEFAPLATCARDGFALNPTKPYKVFCLKLSNSELEKVNSINARIEWDGFQGSFSK